MKTPRMGQPRHLAAILAVAVLAIAVALPVLAASPSPSVAPAASAGGPEPKASKEPKGPKEAREPTVQVTIRGTVKSTTDAQGRPDFALDANGKTLKLDAGPKWFLGTKNPLLPFVGKTVTIVGEQSGDEIDVSTVDGTAIRAPGKPPWAGGWKVVGKDHPGWSQAKADRWAAKQKAREAARAACIAAGQTPDQCKGHGNGIGNGRVGGDADESPEPAETPGIG